MQNPIPSTISSIKTMSHWLRITIDTQENLTSEQKKELFDLYEKMGWFFFLDQPEAQIDTTKLPKLTIEKGEKTPAERLRAVLFIYWEQNKLPEDFDIWYRKQIESYIDQVKAKLS